MSTAYLKTKTKQLKEALGAKDWPAVEKHANDVLSFESSNYNARVFLSLALFNLGRFDESEESYKKAIEGAPTQGLARQGLAAFYEKRQRWGDYAWVILELMQLFEESGDAIKYGESLQKLIDVRRSHGTVPEVIILFRPIPGFAKLTSYSTQLIQALSLLLPSSPSHKLLLQLPPATPTAPLSTSLHSLQLSLLSALPTLLELTSLTESFESSSLTSELNRRRQRLGGTTLSAAETRRRLEAEMMPSSGLPGLYKAILEDPDAGSDEELRRNTERKLLGHLGKVLKALPSSFDERSEVDLKKVEKRKEVMEEEERDKERVRGEVEELARGMVVVGVKEEEAWRITMDWRDSFGTWESVDWRELERYCEIFPESGLANIANALRKRRDFANAAPVEEGSDEEKNPPPPTDEETMEIIEAGLAASPDSLLAHLLSVHFFSEKKEWDAVFQVAEAGLSILEGIEKEIGRYLPISRRTLDSHLAISLVHLDPPNHHLRALRLLDSLLSTSPGPEIPLLTAKAYVLQYAEKWLLAVAAWDQVLSSSPTTSSAETEVKAERSWCLFNAGELESAHQAMLEVVETLEARKAVRDEEKKVKEKARSKAGLERGEGVEEGETTSEALERATAHWRLGQCLWELGETDPDQNAPAYDAFIASVLATPTFAPAFTSLGIYYQTVEPPDYSRSSQCFSKAFELDDGQEVAARYLAEEFSEIGDWSLVEVVARRVVDGAGGKSALGGKAAQRLSWAWKAIGGAELNSKKYPQAIVAFQSALRGAPRDSHTWIRLGVAYHSSGKHIAALKVFAKALELDPTSWYAQFSIGDVQREIGLLGPAIKTFQAILVDRPKELGVRVVLAETYLAAGLDELRGGFLARAEESLVDALTFAVDIIEAGSATRIAWKIAGDAAGALGKIPQHTLLDRSKPLGLRLIALIEGLDVDSKIENGMDAVQVPGLKAVFDTAEAPLLFLGLATLACKTRVLVETHNEVSIGSAWLDLGLSLSNVRPHLAALNLPATSDEALHQSIRCLKFALHKEPYNFNFWNALGVLSFDLSPRLSQHAFIKAIEHNSRGAIAWANLGLFYLVHHDEDLANQAFLKAQVIDPDWGAAWVGQATLAELAGHTTEAAVLLAHAFTLAGSTPEADIGFANSAFNKYRAASDPAPPAEALSAPLFALTRYLSQRPEDVSAIHLCALILEQVGDLDSASESLEKAAAILSDLYDTDESPEVEGRFIVAQTNLGRVRLAKEDYEGAVTAFDFALSLLPSPKLPWDDSAPAGGLGREESVLLHTECRLGTGLAQFWLGETDEAIQMLSEGLDELDELPESRKADLAVTLARIYWSQEDEDRALSSILDIPDIVTEKTPLVAKLALQAFATITRDEALLGLVGRVNRDPLIKYQSDSTRISVLSKLLKHDPAGAVAAVSRSVHATPWVTANRRALAQLLIDLPPKPGSGTANSNLEICSRFVRTHDVEGEGADPKSRRLVGVATTYFSQEGKEDLALSMLEKAVFTTPWTKTARRYLSAVSEALVAV
ncbi:superkiller protein 3, partial [Phenoliferia sp. Uapishka_3]